MLNDGIALARDATDEVTRNPSMKKRMQLVIAAAMLLAMVGALFGAGMARLLWADDLKQAQRIDEIRSRTEASLMRTITAHEATIKALQAQRDILQSQVH